LRFAREFVVAATCLIAGTLEPRAASALNVTLHWTATGDDGTTGTATQYEMRYSLSPITAANFGSAINIPGLPAPRPAGSNETFIVPNLPNVPLVYLAMRARDEAGNWSAISNVLSVGGTVDVEDAALVAEFSLPMPNPARMATRFSLTLPTAGDVRIETFDLSGRRVRVLADGPASPGTTDVVWDLRDDSGGPVETGVYFVKAAAAGVTWTRRIAVVR
jgi:FlgD Ig-like domain